MNKIEKGSHDKAVTGPSNVKCLMKVGKDIPEGKEKAGGAVADSADITYHLW